MQNNEQNHGHSVRRFLQEKGYYIVLSLCILAVGISGYVFVSSALRQSGEGGESLSVAVTTPDPDEDRKTAVQTPAEDPFQPPLEDDAPPKQEQSAPVSATVAETTVLPVQGTVTQVYAMDRLAWQETTQDWRTHQGLDLAAEAGQTVVAARSGTVTAVYEDEYYGVTVVLQHRDGYATHYCGLAEGPAVSAGETVLAGETLGLVGRTALIESAAGPHLHFEVYRNGDPMDPAAFLE